MAYEWDNKKPTAQMLGRWQPFHDGHYTLFKELSLIHISEPRDRTRSRMPSSA